MAINQAFRMSGMHHNSLYRRQKGIDDASHSATNYLKQVKVHPLGPYQAMVSRTTFENPFKNEISQKVCMVLAFLNPDAVRTQYMLVLPANSLHVDRLYTDPTLMIDVMRQIFPKSDHGDSTLQLAQKPMPAF